MTGRRKSRDCGGQSASSCKKLFDLTNDLSCSRGRNAERHVVTGPLGFLVALMVQPACRAGSDQLVSTRPVNERCTWSAIR